ncbi:MAG: Hsp20/alpha crystallin family protein [Desulfobulbaceae bacterium]|nr:Hsp20/alpha crystallin family protein [Desulfobulbaceae bacterium]
MDLVPRKPFGELSILRREMDDLWNRFFNDPPFGRLISQQWLPSVDIDESKDKLVVKVELPGLDAKDVSVSLADDLLTIRGEKKQESEEKDATRHTVERYYGTFERSFRLPMEIKADKVEATFDKGVLKITLPKAEVSKRKEIEIKVK